MKAWELSQARTFISIQECPQPGLKLILLEKNLQLTNREIMSLFDCGSDRRKKMGGK